MLDVRGPVSERTITDRREFVDTVVSGEFVITIIKSIPFVFFEVS